MARLKKIMPDAIFDFDFTSDLLKFVNLYKCNVNTGRPSQFRL